MSHTVVERRQSKFEMKTVFFFGVEYALICLTGGDIASKNLVTTTMCRESVATMKM